MSNASVMSAPNDFHALLDAAPDAMVVVDRDGQVTALNAEAERFFGWTEHDLLGESMSRCFPPRFHRLLGYPETPGGATAASTHGGTISCFARRKDGSEFPVELTRRRVGHGDEAKSLVTLRDLTQWRHAQETRSRSNEQARATLESIGDAVITSDAAGVITYLNPVAERLTGWSGGEALGQSLDAVLPLISEASRHPVANTAARCLREGRSIDLEEGVLLLRRDGTEVPIGDSAAPVRDRNGRTTGVVLVIQDESEKRRVGHRLSYEATHDSLTGLINRREFERRLGRVLAGLEDTAGEHVLLCLDLDRFKAINDSCGHDAGDEMLRRLGALLSCHTRKRDTLARLGGDEFAVLLENCPLAEAQRIAENIRSEVEGFSFVWEGQDFRVGTSVGLIPLTGGSGGSAAVMRVADIACYVAKEAGGNRIHLEHPSGDPPGMSKAAARRVTRLARAVDEGHFQLYAQAIVPLRPAVRPALPAPRYEILLRLPDGKGRVQAAAEFLPRAERASLMPAIDRWVVREAIALLGQWQRDYPDSELPGCSINLSPSALTDGRLIPLLEQQLARHGVPARTLCFEFAERAALANLAGTLDFIAGLRSAGCGVALDDVGGGVTSLTYLKTLSVDFLKIGGPLVHAVVADPVSASIVGSVNQIGLSMGAFTIAKEVGSTEVLDKLRALGIGYAQGNAVAAPVPLADLNGRLLVPPAGDGR